MTNEEYHLLSIDETYSIPRALILVIHNGKPSSSYQIDVYGYELPPFGQEVSEEKLNTPTDQLNKENEV